MDMERVIQEAYDNGYLRGYEKGKAEMYEHMKNRLDDEYDARYYKGKAECVQGGDLIRRSDAIEAIKDNSFALGDDYMEINGYAAIDDIRALPSADRPQGKWLLSDFQSQADNDNGNYAYVCTNCNHTDIHAKTQKVPYCWWCGVRMKGADDEADNE